MFNVMEAFSLKDRVIAVTGSTGNLGAHFCEGLAQAGASLALTDIEANREKLIELVNDLSERYQIQSKYYIMDINYY